MKKRTFSFLLALAMCVSMFPFGSLAAVQTGGHTGLCPHHTQHTAACGYTAGTSAAPCAHVHDEDCGYTAAEELQPDQTPVPEETADAAAACAHIHDEACGYAEAAAAQPCTFVCSICPPETAPTPTPAETAPADSYTVTDWAWVDDLNMLMPAAQAGVPDMGWAMPLAFAVSRGDLEVLLPAQIIAVLESGDVVTLPITWDFDAMTEYTPPAGEADGAAPAATNPPPVFPLPAGDEAADDTGMMAPTIGAGPGIEEPGIEEPGTPPAETGSTAPSLPLDQNFTAGDGENHYYRITARLPEGYALAADAASLNVLVMLAGVTPLWELPDDDFELEATAALHFIIRNWHTTETSGTFDDGSDNTETEDGTSKVPVRYFVVAEGYIVPKEDGPGYEFYMALQSDGKDLGDDFFDKGDFEEALKKGDLVKVEAGDSDYIKSVDETLGTIVIQPNPVENDEVFSEFSVSAGHDAVTNEPENCITIHYRNDVHLVKAHVFYLIDNDTKHGTNDKEVFPVTEKEEPKRTEQKNKEQDTSYVYLYTKVLDEYAEGQGHQVGDIVKTEEGTPVKNAADLKLAEGEDAALTKVYSTHEGLHTDKTASVSALASEFTDAHGYPDGRTFDMELEAWYTEGQPPQVAMLLDASGSMGFAADIPTPIKVTDFDQSVQEALKSKLNGVGPNFQVEDDFMKSLAGYYEFQQNSSGEKANALRNWYLNSVEHAPSATYTDMNASMFAKAAEQASISGDVGIDFSTTTGGIMKPADYKSNGLFAGYSYDGWGAGQAPANFSANDGMYLSSNTANAAFVPEAQPTGNSFTVSFTLKESTADSAFEKGDQRIHILYVGPSTSNTSAADFFHVYRQGNSIYACMGLNGKTLFKLSPNYSTDQITFAFKDGTVTAYVGGVEKGSHAIQLGGNTVVFAPFKGYQSGTHKFGVDNIFAFNQALNESQVNALCPVVGKDIKAVQDVKTVDAFLTSSELALLMDPRKTDSSRLGVANYTYFVYDPNSATTEYIPLGYYSGIPIGGGKSENINGEGWYYATFAGWSAELDKSDVGAKRLLGVVSGTLFTDTITPGNTVDPGAGGAIPPGAADQFKINPGDGDTNYTYTATAASPVKFYIDEAGYLRCFFSRSITDNSGFTSYVYELADGEYLKTEALQRAIGMFVTELADLSPSAQVGAVRFNGQDAAAPKVLQYWTSDPAKSANMLTPNYDDNKSQYILTGGTYMLPGLNTLDEQLLAATNSGTSGLNTDSDQKFIILFTDGDNQSDNKDTINKARQLRKDGWTIYVVLLAGGSFDTTKAEEFLPKVAGPVLDKSASTNVTEANAPKSDGYLYVVQGSDGADTQLAAAFSAILAEIVDPLNDYSVKEYIDPRFDLVDKDRTVYHLNAGGKVFLNDSDTAAFTASDISAYTIPIFDSSTKEAQNPYLRYNANKDMYYLQWIGQTIPTSAEGADELTVWNAKFMLRAKDDFIGGNAILTDGNEPKMNYVYNPKDPGQNASSGTNDMYRSYSGDTTTDDPSKGFPRTVVNVALSNAEYEHPSMLFMGEELTLESSARILIEEAADKAEEGESLAAKYAWDYLSRYAARHSVGHDGVNGNRAITFDYLIKRLADEGNIIIPYSYLPDQNKANSTGGWEHEQGYVGYLDYQIVEEIQNWEELFVPQYYKNGDDKYYVDANGNLRKGSVTDPTVYYVDDAGYLHIGSPDGQKLNLNINDMEPSEQPSGLSFLESVGDAAKYKGMYGEIDPFPTGNSNVRASTGTRVMRLMIIFYPLPMVIKD